MARNHRQVLEDLIREHGWKAGVELGVFKGENLFHQLERFPDLHMVGVDKWQRVGANVEQDRETGVVSYDKPMELHYANAQRLMKEKYRRRCSLIKGGTAESAALFLDEQFDFVFVDADHTAASVAADVRAWLPKVKQGGALVGHDASWPSVQRGLAASLGANWINLGEGNCWIWWRPNERA